MANETTATDRAPIRVLVTGTSGQVVTALVERAAGRADVAVTTIGRPEVDFAQPDGLAEAIAAREVDVVVNAAAYTAVDKAESEPEIALAVNATAAGAVARGAAMRGIPVVQISTDYVFDGSGETAREPGDPTGPIGAYGRTKLAGEEAVATANPRHLIMRTAWVYSPFGANFVKTMLRVAETRDTLSVVGDQFGNPTSALDIADAIFAALPALIAAKEPLDQRLFHLAGTGETSWHGFAEGIFAAAATRALPSASVNPITTADYPTPAKRPANSRLSSEAFAQHFGYRPPRWQDSLAVVMDRLQAERAKG